MLGGTFHCPPSLISETALQFVCCPASFAQFVLDRDPHHFCIWINDHARGPQWPKSKKSLAPGYTVNLSLPSHIRLPVDESTDEIGSLLINRLMCAHFGWDQFSYRTLYGIETSQLQVRLQLVWN